MTLRRTKYLDDADEEEEENPEEATHANDEVERAHSHDVCVPKCKVNSINRFTKDTLLDQSSTDKIFSGQNFSADKILGTK